MVIKVVIMFLDPLIGLLNTNPLRISWSIFCYSQIIAKLAKNQAVKLTVAISQQEKQFFFYFNLYKIRIHQNQLIV